MHKTQRTRIIFDRFAALLALTAAASYGCGIRIWVLAVTACAVSLLTERICLLIRKQTFTRRNLDAAVTGMVLLMLLSPAVPVSLLIMSCIFAIIIGRQMFGGTENPVMPAAAAGFCFCLLNDRNAAAMYPSFFQKLPLQIRDTVQLSEGYSFVWNRIGRFSTQPADWLSGLPAQPIGTGSIVLLIVIAVVLILRRSASGWLVLPAMGGIILFNLAFGNLLNPAMCAVGSCLTNQTLFALIFLHGDPDYAPPKFSGLAYGLLCAIVMTLFTRILYVSDAPVMLAVLLSPFAVFLRRLWDSIAMEKTVKRGEAAG